MKNFPPSHSPRREHGVALVLVLCFVVLITGLVVAYFSRTLNTRQLSNASTSTEQAEQLANSATDVILGDLKQEIVNGSTLVTGLPTGVTVYIPTAAADAVPQRNAAPTPVPATTPAVGPIPNLVRSSLRSDTTAGNNNYVPAPGVTSRASAAASSTPSANGRFVSPARWNRHYLIPTYPADPGPTPTITASTPISAFTPPDWVFVTAEKGPDVLLPTNPFQDTNGSNVTPIGRYAYAIYDEGGLLDINHTGFPSASTFSHVGAKPAPSYADLTQLPSPSAAPSSSVLTVATVDNLLGWRNFATLQPAGSFPAFYTTSPSATPQTTTSAPDTAYYGLFTSSPTNLLQVASTVYNGKTDQMFLSRQQLIGYFAAAGLDPIYLQYLATFTRGLNQPSYVPESNPNPRPVVLPINQGGNDSYGNNNITPNFLATRVVNTFTRYDLTPAVVGEPLLKKRFPLNRLAWLTYKGPSATRNQTDPDMAALIAAGIPPNFLNQGTATNIATYFGLQWGANPPNADNTASGNGWTYIHGTVGTSGAILNINNPTAATDVVRLNPGREPDFFELLKASINPGSIAKASIAPSVQNDNSSYTHVAQSQQTSDNSLDTAILQIGANIIDQFDTDGFPTRINYNLAGSGALASLFGVENLPYISRVRAGLIRLAEANPPDTTTNAASTPIKHTGLAALMNFPEVWNPHDYSTNNPTQTAGAVGPHNFQIFATTNFNNGVQSSTSVYVWDQSGTPSSSSYVDQSQSPDFKTLYGFSWGVPPSPGQPQRGGETRYLSLANTYATFTMANQGLFREPTILYSPGKPAGSQLAFPSLVAGNAALGNLGSNANTAGFFAPSANGGGLISAVSASSSGSGVPSANSAYGGFYIGAHPMRFWDTNGSPNNNSAAFQTQYGPVNDVTYTLECDDGASGWIRYDNKAVTTTGSPNSNLYTGLDTGFGLNGTTTTGSFNFDYGVRYFETVDPRSSRFGMMDPYIDNSVDSIPPRLRYSAINVVQGTLKPDREGVNSGTSFNFNAFAGGNYVAGDWYDYSIGWYHTANNTAGWFRPGLLAQNNPNVTPDGQVGGSVPSTYNGTATYTPFYYADADGMVRRASGGNVQAGTGASASTTVGLATAFASATTSSTNTLSQQIDSRPVILNRPFRSVAELGYVYSGTPWKNLDFVFPESGDSAMLDVFCVNDNSDSNALTAGSVNLNTRQFPVLQAVLAQTNKDQWNDATSVAGTTQTTILGGNGAEAQQIAQLLVTRTVAGSATGPMAKQPQPLRNISDLIGRFVGSSNLTGVSGSNASFQPAGINGQLSYDGFTADLASFEPAGGTMPNIQRFEESAVRALSNGGQTRVWNLMFDIVAQTGRYSTQATKLDQFNVEGEQHYWVHVAIDRYTGQVIDKEVEVVKE